MPVRPFCQVPINGRSFAERLSRQTGDWHSPEYYRFSTAWAPYGSPMSQEVAEAVRNARLERVLDSFRGVQL